MQGEPAFNTSRRLPHAHHGAHTFTYEHTEQYGIKGMDRHTRLINILNLICFIKKDMIYLYC